MNEDSLREMDADFSIHARGINRKTEFIKNNFTFLLNEDELKEVIESASRSNEKRFILRYL
jgi:hypothetical protein